MFQAHQQEPSWYVHQKLPGNSFCKQHQKYKNEILTTYPETKFAQIIKNPDAKFQEEEATINEVEKTYKEMYYLYKADKFEEVITKTNEFLPTIQNSELLPKFELLKAFAIGKFQDKIAYQKALEFVAVSYGNTEEGKKAKAIVAKLVK